jgi:hypothetical protein
MPPPAETVRQMIDGYRVSQIVCVAAELGIPDLLKDGPRNVGSLAAAAGADPECFARLMRALGGLGILTQVEPGAFALNPLSRCLLSGEAQSLRALARACLDQWYAPWGKLKHAVLTGETAFEHLYGTDAWTHRRSAPASGQCFHEAMSAVAAGMTAAIVAAYDFSPFATVVDVGGGDGTLLGALLRAHPRMRGILFDSLAAANASGRLEALKGDFFESVPRGGDCYLLSRVIHDWKDQDAIRILRNTRAAMDFGHVLLVVERVMPTQSPGTEAVLSDINMMVMNGGRERTLEDFRALLAAASFELCAAIPTISAVSILEAKPL